MLTCRRQSQPTTTSSPQLNSASPQSPIWTVHSYFVSRGQASFTAATTFAILLWSSLSILPRSFLLLSSIQQRSIVLATTLNSSSARTQSSQCRCTCEHCRRSHLTTVHLVVVFLPDLFPPTLLLQFFLLGLPQCSIDSAKILRSTLFLYHREASPLHSAFISYDHLPKTRPRCLHLHKFFLEPHTASFK